MLALSGRGYLAALQRYRAALARRNATLREAARTGKAAEASVAVWEPPLAQHGATLVRERRVWVEECATRFERITAEIGEPTRVSMRYATDVEDPSADDETLVASLRTALERKRSVDLRRGVTHTGPHRDDLVITLAGADGGERELRSFGSAGQQRSAAIALRMLEAATLTSRLGRAPVFLLDDPFAELDERRSANVLSVLVRAGLGQTILAVPRESDIPSEFTELERARVAGGAIARFTPA
jgi:DNA replication and repair protein RecF